MPDIKLRVQNEDLVYTGVESIVVRGEDDEDVTFKIPQTQEKAVTANGEVVPDEGYDGLSKVTVNVVPRLESKSYTIKSNSVVPIAPTSGYDGIRSGNIYVNVPPATFQDKNVKVVSRGPVFIRPDSGVDGLSKVDITVENKNGLYRIRSSCDAIGVSDVVGSDVIATMTGFSIVRHRPEGNSNEFVVIRSLGMFSSLIIQDVTIDTSEGIRHYDYGYNSVYKLVYSRINVTNITIDGVTYASLTRGWNAFPVFGSNVYRVYTSDSDPTHVGYLELPDDLNILMPEVFYSIFDLGMAKKTVTIDSNTTTIVRPDEKGLYEVEVVTDIPEAPVVLQEKTVTPTIESQEVTFDAPNNGLSKVVVEGIAAGTLNVTESGEYTPVEGYFYNSVIVNVPPAIPSLQEKSVILTDEEPYARVTPDNGFHGLSSVYASINSSGLKSENIKFGETILGVRGKLYDAPSYCLRNSSPTTRIWCNKQFDWSSALESVVFNSVTGSNVEVALAAIFYSESRYLNGEYYVAALKQYGKFAVVIFAADATSSEDIVVLYTSAPVNIAYGEVNVVSKTSGWKLDYVDVPVPVTGMSSEGLFDNLFSAKEIAFGSWIKPSGTLTIRRNGSYDVSGYANVVIDIQGGSTPDPILDNSTLVLSGDESISDNILTLSSGTLQDNTLIL